MEHQVKDTDGILLPALAPEAIQKAEEQRKQDEAHEKALRERLLDIYVRGGCTYAWCEAGYLLFAQPGDERNSIVCGAPAVVTFEQESGISGGVSEDYTIPGAVLVKSEPLKGGGWEKVFKVQARLCATHLFRLMETKYGRPEERKEGRHCCIVPKNQDGDFMTFGQYYPDPERCCLEPVVAGFDNQHLCFYHLANLLSKFPDINVEKLEGGAA